METKRSVLGTLLATSPFVAAPVLAATGEGNGGIGFWMILFLAFGALIIAFQLIPAAVMFVSMLRGLFQSARGRVGGSEKAEKRA